MKRAIIISLLFLAQVTFQHSIESNSLNDVLYVGGSGEGNYSSIQDAINDALDGYTIIVYPGVYNENIVINKQVTLIGKDRDNTVINGGMKDDVVFITASNVKIEGFTITNSGSVGDDAGVRIYDYTRYCKISNCSIINCNRGIFGYHISYATIKNCTISNVYRKSGIAFYYSSHNSISNLTVKNINWTGIYFNGGGYNAIENCDVSNCKAYAITLDFSEHCTVSNCKLEKSMNGIKLSHSSHNEFYGNIITESLGSGIVLFPYSDGNIVSYCHLYNNGYNGIYMRECKNNQVEGNIIEENNRNGIYMESSNAVNITRCNIVKNKQCGVYLMECSEITANYNNIYDNGFGIGIFANESHCDARYNYWGTIFGPITFGLLGDGIMQTGDASIQFFPWKIFRVG